MAWVAYKDTGYYISDDGHVKNIKGHILSNINRREGGYLCVNIRGKLKSIHRLVAETFIPNPLNYEVVNHKDGNKHNNDVSNLEWCSRSYNQRHAFETGLQHARKGFENICSKHVLMIDKLGVVRKAFGSIQEAANFVGLKCYSNISRCCSGERKSAAGYYWKFCTLPQGSIKKLIGKELTWKDEPVELKEE